MDDHLPPELLSQVLRWSLHAHAHSPSQITTTTNDLDSDFRNSTNPAIKELIRQIHYTRRFTPTYLAVLGLVVLVFSVLHWWRTCTRRRRSKRNGILQHVGSKPRDECSGGDGSSSSGSSTLQGSSSPKTPSIEDAGETTALLPALSRSVSSGRHRRVDSSSYPLSPPSPWTRLRHRLSSALTYQPRPIPALTSPSNVLPQNGTSLGILFFLGLNLVYLLYRIPFKISLLFVFADRAGLLFVVNLPMLYLLAAKNGRLLLLGKVTGWGYEGLNIWHRRLGEWMTLLGVVHGAGMMGVWYTLLRPLGFVLARFLSTKLVILGLVALAVYLIIWGTSTGWFRKLWYETFLGLHIILQVAALVLLFFHHPGARVYVAVSLGIWAADRILGRMLLRSRRFIATLQVADSETVLLFCDIDIRPANTTSGLQNLTLTTGWQPGQHVFLTIPALSACDSWQTHPFTIASPAPPPSYRGVWPLQLTIRAQAGFSAALLRYAEQHQHVEVVLDGPYGSCEALDALRAAERKCLVAGGSGVAVTWPLVWNVLVGEDGDAVVSRRVVYRDGKKTVPALRETGQPEAMVEGRVGHFWVNQHKRHREWLTMVPRRGAVRGRVLEGRGEEAPEDAVDVIDIWPRMFSTRDRELGDGDTVSSGRPDVALELRRWVEDGIGAASGFEKAVREEKICVVVSGPDELVRDVNNSVSKLVLQGWRIEVFVEKFGW